MRLVLHQEVYSDINKIMDYYEQAGDPQLADDFYNELRHLMEDAAKRPEGFSIRERDIRRAYHFLFRIAGDKIRVLVVRHHCRHPALGLRRR